VDEEDVSSYWINLGQSVNSGNRYKIEQDELFGVHAVKETKN
jgi:hypothetical protein